MNNVNYTIIIPHHNEPTLLQRCIDSIPKRDDLQIIVVDDNSDDDLADFDNLIFLSNSNVEIYYTKEGKGAGYARNVGLKYAKGKWVVFADADDTFETDNINSVMNKYINSLYDLIVFNVNICDACTMEIERIPRHFQLSVINNTHADIEWIKYNFTNPWGKFVKKELIEKFNIKFDEVVAGNDVMFSMKSQHYAEHLILDNTIIYNWILRNSGNISSNFSRSYILSKLNVATRQNKFFNEENIDSKYRVNLFNFVPPLHIAGYSYLNAICKVCLCIDIKYVLKDFITYVLNFLNNKTKNMRKRIRKIIAKPHLFISVILLYISPMLSDKLYLRVQYWLKNKYWLDLKNPKTFNEKLNWLKLHDRKPLYTTLADKYHVKEYVSQKIGEEFVVPCYGKWDCFEDIDIDSLPNQFVIKTNHDSSGAFICRDKTQLDRKKLKTFVNKSLHRNYYWHLREWPYKNIKPCVIAEKLLDDGTGEVIRDYKFWCFHGEPKYMYCTVKGVEIYENFYDMNFEPVDINHGFPRHKPEFEKPTNFDLMKRIARELSEDIPFVRIDFFDIAGQVYLGEYTFYDWGGIRPFISIEQDIELGRLISLKS